MTSRITAAIQLLLVLVFLTFQSPAIAALYAACGEECRAANAPENAEATLGLCCCQPVQHAEISLPRELPRCCALHTVLEDVPRGSMTLTTPLEPAPPAPVEIGEVAEFSWSGVPLAPGISREDPRPMDPIAALHMRGVQLL